MAHYSDSPSGYSTSRLSCAIRQQTQFKPPKTLLADDCRLKIRWLIPFVEASPVEFFLSSVISNDPTRCGQDRSCATALEILLSLVFNPRRAENPFET